MSLAKINNFANDDTDILAVQSTVDALYNNSYSLTNYDNTTVPAIAAGSKIEVNGSLYRAATEEAISTTDPVTSSTVADGTVYICMIPSGDASTCTAAFTATAPTWSDSKQGWYGTGGQANYKYLPEIINKATASYKKHRIRPCCFPRFLNLISGHFTSASEGQLEFTADYDLLSEKSSNVISLAFSGLYMVSVGVTGAWSNSDAGAKSVSIQIRNNTDVIGGTSMYFASTSAPGTLPLSLSKEVFANAGDEIDFYGDISGGTSPVFNGYFNIRMI